MNVQAKYWWWVHISRVVIIMMLGRNFAFADDSSAKNDALYYWETRLHGARMSSSVLAMLSPLRSSEVSHFAVDLSAPGGLLSPAQAAAFCKAASIQCAPGGLQFGVSQTDETQARNISQTAQLEESNKGTADSSGEGKKSGKSPSPYGKKGRYGRKKRADGEGNPILPANFPSSYGKEGNPGNPLLLYGRKERIDEEPADIGEGNITLYTYGRKDGESADGEGKITLYVYGREGKKPVDGEGNSLFIYGKEGNPDGEGNPLLLYERKERIYEAPADGEANITLYIYGRKDGESADGEVYNTLYIYGREGKKPVDGEDNSLFIYGKVGNPDGEGNPLLYRRRKDEEPADGEGNSLFIYGREGKKRVDGKKVVNYKASRLLASRNVHELRGIFFHEKQVLVNGTDICENFGSYEGDALVDKFNGRAFLPRKLASFLLREGGVKMVSILGYSHEEVQRILRVCNGAGIPKNVEVRKCVSSVEDLADFVGSILGVTSDGGEIAMYDSISNASQVHRHKAGDFFRIHSVKALSRDSEPSVVCHDNLRCPFRLFGCHYTKQSKIFQVVLRGEDGRAHERIAICHYNTTYWNPEHRAFRDVHTKPGESELCHWLGGRSHRQIAWAFVRRSAAVV